MPAASALQELEQSDRLRAHPGLQHRIIDVFEEAVVREHIDPRVHDHAVRVEAVAARPSDLLIPALDVARHVAVDHEAHVALVDPHAERDRRDDHVALIAGERVLVPRPLLVAEPRVIRQRTDAFAREPGRELLDAFARDAVHDPRLAAMRADETQQVRTPGAALALLDRRDDEVRPEERSLESLRPAHPELLDDVADHAPRRGRGQGEDGDVAELRLQSLKLPVRGPEVVAPLADAVRLVDDQQRGMRGRQLVPQPIAERLRRDVEKLDLFAPQCVEPRATLLPRDRGVEHGRSKTGSHQRVDLVLHERDQRRDDDHRSREQLRGDLERQALSGAGRHQPDAVAAGKDGVDDLELAGTELRIAEDRVKNRFRSGQRQPQDPSPESMSGLSRE